SLYYSSDTSFLSVSSSSANNRDLHSFPTRRSSDLNDHPVGRHLPPGTRSGDLRVQLPRGGRHGDVADHHAVVEPGGHRFECQARSEEHTSELQSRENIVCRLLLAKKKK